MSEHEWEECLEAATFGKVIDGTYFRFYVDSKNSGFECTCFHGPNWVTETGYHDHFVDAYEEALVEAERYAEDYIAN